MPRQLVQQLPRPGLPNHRGAIPAPRRDPLPPGIPTRSYQIPFHPRRRAVIRPHRAIDGRKRPHVPRAHRAILPIRQQRLRIGTDRQARHRILMARHAVRDTLLSDIPNLDIIINTAGIDLVPRLTQRHRRYGELAFQEGRGALLARVPEADVAVVRGRGEHLGTPTASVEAVDELVVALVSADARARFQIPGSEGGVGGGGEEDARVARPGEVKDRAFVAGQVAVVFALAVGAPED